VLELYVYYSDQIIISYVSMMFPFGNRVVVVSVQLLMSIVPNVAPLGIVTFNAARAGLRAAVKVDSTSF
jgi:hypothetical protein